MRKILIAALLLFTANSFAQTWVQVPDPNFQAFLTANYPASAFMTSGSDFFVDADHPDIQGEDSLDISNLNIGDLNGVSGFENLKFLYCPNNQLTNIPVLPDSLLYFFCYSNQLTSLTNLPSTLIGLYCGDNQINSITALPPTLSFLTCESNGLNTLLNLPENLYYLSCPNNNLTELPILPVDLHNLNCSNNLLSSLPILPAELTTLYCIQNQLTQLPQLPSNLQYLWCNDNQISSLPTLPVSMVTLLCAMNELLVLPDLPSSITDLQCSYNQLFTLPTLPTSLLTISCDHNQLSSIPSLPLLLTDLHCESNFLTSLPEIPQSIQFLMCDSNQIACFPVFPEAALYVSLSGNPFSCLPNYVPAMFSDLLAYPLCNENDPVNNPNGCQSAMGIQGSVFDDANNDCVDSGLPLIYIPMVLNDNTGTTITMSTNLVNGDYYFAAAEGDYELAINTTVLSPALQVTCPVNNENTATVTQAVPEVEGGDFGLVCSGFDLGVQSVVPNGLVFPGQTHELHILAGDLTAQFQAYCATGISGDVSIAVSGPGTIAFSGSPSIAGNTATYAIADFGAVGANVFSASILTDTTANSSDEFCVSVTVTTATTGDLNASNNTYSYCYHVVNSYDPNIKETYPELVASGFTDEFTYTIHFQNTGNAPAINIRLADVLDENLDLTSLKIVDASSDYTFSVNAVSRMMSIRFPNIMLADSASDPEGSIGYVQYRIKPFAGLPNETIIENTCSIYFDYNSPIVTNTTQNVFGYLGMNELSDLDIQLYPNPASNVVMFESTEEMESIEFFTLNGVKVNELQPNMKKTKVNVSSFENGVYIVKIHSKSGIINKRLVVN